MKADFKKAIAVAVAAGVLAAGSLAAASPAAADGYYGRGWGHGHGGHGWGHGHGGHGWGWGHGGWRRHGWGHGHGGHGWGWGHGGWRRHGWGHGGWGAPVAAGVLGALAVGAAVGAAQNGYYGYGSCYPANQPVVDGWGNIVAYRNVQVCD